MVLHCPAEIHKAFPEIDVIWRGAYVALKPFILGLHDILHDIVMTHVQLVSKDGSVIISKSPSSAFRWCGI